MTRIVVVFLPTLLLGCLEDGRPEAEFLEEYGVTVDVGADTRDNETVVTKHTSEGDGCSPPKPAETFLIEVENDYGQDIFLHLADPEQDCAETFARVIRRGNTHGVDGWDGAIYRIRDNVDGEFLLELRSGDSMAGQFLVVP